MLEAHGFKTFGSCGLSEFREKHKDLMVYPPPEQKKPEQKK